MKCGVFLGTKFYYMILGKIWVFYGKVFNGFFFFFGCLLWIKFCVWEMKKEKRKLCFLRVYNVRVELNTFKGNILCYFILIIICIMI